MDHIPERDGTRRHSKRPPPALRPNMYNDIGNVGRKTGFKPRPGIIVDADGLENVEDFFRSDGDSDHDLTPLKDVFAQQEHEQQHVQSEYEQQSFDDAIDHPIQQHHRGGISPDLAAMASQGSQRRSSAVGLNTTAIINNSNSQMQVRSPMPSSKRIMRGSPHPGSMNHQGHSHHSNQHPSENRRLSRRPQQPPQLDEEDEDGVVFQDQPTDRYGNVASPMSAPMRGLASAGPRSGGRRLSGVRPPVNPSPLRHEASRAYQYDDELPLDPVAEDDEYFESDTPAIRSVQRPPYGRQEYASNQQQQQYPPASHQRSGSVEIRNAIGGMVSSVVRGARRTSTPGVYAPSGVHGDQIGRRTSLPAGYAPQQQAYRRNNAGTFAEGNNGTFMQPVVEEDEEESVLYQDGNEPLQPHFVEPLRPQQQQQQQPSTRRRSVAPPPVEEYNDEVSDAPVWPAGGDASMPPSGRRPAYVNSPAVTSRGPIMPPRPRSSVSQTPINGVVPVVPTRQHTHSMPVQRGRQVIEEEEDARWEDEDEGVPTPPKTHQYQPKAQVDPQTVNRMPMPPRPAGAVRATAAVRPVAAIPEVQESPVFAPVENTVDDAPDDRYFDDVGDEGTPQIEDEQPAPARARASAKDKKSKEPAANAEEDESAADEAPLTSVPKPATTGAKARRGRPPRSSVARGADVASPDDDTSHDSATNEEATEQVAVKGPKATQKGKGKAVSIEKPTAESYPEEDETAPPQPAKPTNGKKPAAVTKAVVSEEEPVVGRRSRKSAEKSDAKSSSESSTSKSKSSSESSSSKTKATKRAAGKKGKVTATVDEDQVEDEVPTTSNDVTMDDVDAGNHDFGGHDGDTYDNGVEDDDRPMASSLPAASKKTSRSKKSQEIEDVEPMDVNGEDEDAAEGSSRPRRKNGQVVVVATKTEKRGRKKASEIANESAESVEVVKKKRKRDSNDDKDDKNNANSGNDITNQGRPKRTRCLPTEYWKGERVVYDKRMSVGGVTQIFKEVLRVTDSTTESKTVDSKASKTTSSAATGGVPRAKRKMQVKPIKPRNRGDPSDGDAAAAVNPVICALNYNTQAEEEIMGVIDESLIDPRVMGAGEFLFQRFFTMGDGSVTGEFAGSGMLVIPKGQEKPNKNSGPTGVGRVKVTVHKSYYEVGAFSHFVIPRGNQYKIENIGDTEAMLPFVQCRIPAVPPPLAPDGTVVVAPASAPVPAGK